MVEHSVIDFENEVEAIRGVGRGKRRGVPVMEVLNKAAQQRRRTMIKNRESAARSRERKQAYQVELELLVARLEKENKQLRREKQFADGASGDLSQICQPFLLGSITRYITDNKYWLDGMLYIQIFGGLRLGEFYLR
ncbi:hypothetical protein Nepgr_033475 [Nepenthes gracilis]|uniref:BZIP domain-containing protein n=1 Tax=Nepenthes gracilis TaxID=150966 RepID=A0AAD3TM06_NEPGR|nr:hypothetical protein Nepgr_033475 [Nepenthes gracilis]